MAYKKPYDLPYGSGDRKASSHASFLNDVLDMAQIHAFFLQHLADESPSNNGLIAFGTVGDNSGLVEAQDVPGDTVKFNPAMGFVNAFPFYIKLESNSSSISEPTGNDRIDTVYIDPATGAYGIETGTESTSPTAPSIDETALMKVAELYMRVGSGLVIRDSDNSTDHYIIDKRTMYGSPWPANPKEHGTVFIPGGHFVSSGGGSNGIKTETFTSDFSVTYTFHEFPGGVSSNAMAEIILPHDLDESTDIEITVLWSSAEDNTGNAMVWEVFLFSLEDGEPLGTLNSGLNVDVSDVVAFPDRVRIAKATVANGGLVKAGAHILCFVQSQTSKTELVTDHRLHSITIKYKRKVGQ